MNMKIRVMGTMDECKQAQDFYRKLGSQSNVKYCTVKRTVSNRGGVGLYRVYVDIAYNDGSNLYGDCNAEAVNTMLACLDGSV